MAKSVVFVIGASGNVGKATVSSLSANYSDKLEIKAGVRNPEKAEELKSLPSVSVVQAEMGQIEKLKTTLKGVDALYIVCPGTENRAQLSIDTAKAAKEAGVKHLLVLSVATADLTYTTFGKQFKKIETEIAKLGVPYTYLRLPLFVDNYFAYQGTIKSDSACYGPVDSSKPYTPVVVGDAGIAAATILSSPQQHEGKTYNVVSDRHTFGDMAKAFSDNLGKEIKYVRVPYADAKAAFMQMGFPDWQAEGVMELYRLIDSGSPQVNQASLNDYTTITGKQPTSLKAWVSQVTGAFK